jgi:hypothetical protein
MRFVLLFLLAGVALPSSSTLTGPAGTLAWTVAPAGDGVRIEGRSPKWSVTHLANADLTPRRTERTDAAGVRVVVDYTATNATVALPDRTLVVEQPGLWDGDTLDVRLGSLVAGGTQSVDFKALDPASGKVYGFQARPQGRETCGARPCEHVRVNLTGLLRAVGPKWHFWFAADGGLLRFQGPIGDFQAEG